MAGEKNMIEDKKRIDGLTQDDLELTLKELQGQLVGVKLQRIALEGSIAIMIERITAYRE